MINYTIIPLGEILNDEFNTTVIEHAFKKFSCLREKDLEDFLIYKAIVYEKTNYGKTFLVIDLDKLNSGELIVVAYFTIAQKAVDISNLTKKKKRKLLGNYPGRDTVNSIPSYLIGQLGRGDDYNHDDFSGQQLLDECYHAISVAARVVGGNMLVLECREWMYKNFYEKQGFNKLYDNLNDEGLYTLYKKIDFNEYWTTETNH